MFSQRTPVLLLLFSPVCILMWRVSSSLRENRLSHSDTGQAYGLSCTGVLLGLLGYFLARTGISLMGRLLCWYTWHLEGQ